MRVTIIGGGLAGCEAAGRLARAGVAARLLEMRPGRNTPAHQTGLLAELVCSNSLKADGTHNAAGLLKAEMEALGSLVMTAARAHAVAAGSALAVDREGFARAMTETVESLPGIDVVRQEARELPPEGAVIVASGPLTSEALAARVLELTGESDLFFYDALAPIVTAESIDLGIAFAASRYGKGGADYLNCPLDHQEYEAFLDALLAARRTPLREFETPRWFEGCLPIEVMAERGRQTLAHGPMKPVGLTDPRTGRWPHAVVQLRRENAEATLYNLVGFQTRLAWPEQERVFRMIPGLARAEFARLGGIHRNTFINSPRLLGPDLALKRDPRTFFAGQITGMEGYLASAAGGIIAGLNAARRARGEGPAWPPPTTMIGALLAYITDPAREDFQPISANFGLLAPLDERLPKGRRKEALVERALSEIRKFARETGGDNLLEFGPFLRPGGTARE
jgi:methylenetetrahydrofolate--tRNA-(uracil-5-)-methyltransferase